MASGDPVVIFLEASPLGGSGATPDILTGGSTPAEKVKVWDFDASSVEYLDYKVQLIGYDGGGLTFRIKWSSEDQTSGD